MRTTLSASLMVALCAGLAAAQPRVVPIVGVPLDVTNGGAVVTGSNAGTYRLALSGSAYAYTQILASTATSFSAYVADDGSKIITDMLNDNANIGPLGSVIGGSWTDLGGFVNLGHYQFVLNPGTPNPPGTINTVRSASRDGRWVVGLGYSGTTTFRAILTDANGPSTLDLGSLGRGSQSFSVSDDGSVVGGRDSGPTLNGNRATVWRKNINGGYDAFHLDAESSTNDSEVGIRAVSADGTIAAGRPLDLRNRLTRFVWNGTTYVRQDLGIPATPPPGATGAPTGFTVRGMSADGSVMVGQMTYPGAGPRAFIWTAALGVRDLAGYLTSINAVGASVTSYGNATAISSDGLTIVGQSAQLSGQPNWVAFLDASTPCIAPGSAPASSTTSLSRCNSIVALNASAFGSGPFTYQWRKDGMNLTIPGPGPNGSSYAFGITNAQIRVNNFTPADAGVYDCVITGACGTTTIQPINVTAVATSPGDTVATALEQNGEGLQSLDFCGAWVNELSASCKTTRADLFIRYTPTFTGMARISTCPTGSNFDTVISVFDQTGTTQLACADDQCGSLAQIDRIAVTAGVPVLVRVAAGTAVPGAPVTVTFGEAPPPAPYDACADALAVQGGVSSLNTVEASNDGTATCNATLGKDVWFRYTPPGVGRVEFRTCGSSFNTVISAYRGCGGTQVACNDNANLTGCSTQSVISNIAVTPFDDIRVRVAGNTAQAAGDVLLETIFTPTTCLVDFNQDGVLNQEDLNGFIAAFLDESIPAGPSGSNARPCAGLPAPYDVLGYAADYNRDCSFDQEDLSGFITEFFLESETTGDCTLG